MRNGGNEEKQGMVNVFRGHSWLLRFEQVHEVLWGSHGRSPGVGAGGLVNGHQGLMDVPQGILWMVPKVSHGQFLWVSHRWAPGSHRRCLGHLMELSWGLMDAPSICCGHS